MAPAVAVADQRVERECTRLGLLLPGHAALGECEQVRVGAQVVAQQGEIARRVRQRREQRWHLGFGEVSTQLLVAGGDRVHASRHMSVMVVPPSTTTYVPVM